MRADEWKVKQVLLNLLSNGLKFTPEGGRVEVRARVVDGMAEGSVADTGVGIAPEDQEAVFEESRQVGTAAKKVEGTGLGLALPGSSSNCTEAGSGSRGRWAWTPPSRSRFRCGVANELILIVEDNPKNLKLVRDASGQGLPNHRRLDVGHFARDFAR